MIDVSVITVTFNPLRQGRAEQLAECIASVRGQRGCRFEHCVIDGGSDDGTVALLERETAGGVLRFTSEPDHGIYDAMNKGARMARGEYLAFLNSDDQYCRSDALVLALRELREESADYCCGECLILPDSPKSGKRLRHVRLDTVFFGMPYCHQSFLIRRDVFLAMGGYDDALRIAADYDLALKLFLSRAPFAVVPEPFAAIRPGGVSANRTKRREEAVEILLKQYAVFRPELTRKEAEAIVDAAKFPDGLLERLLDGRPKMFVRKVGRAVWTLRMRWWRRKLLAACGLRRAER